MTKRIILQRTRFFLSVEGESEQSFVKWWQELSEQHQLHVHLDCQVLRGGGYRTMLENTVRYQKHKERHKAKATILLVDGDRPEYDDGWSLSKLKQEASKCSIIVCVQNPNLEGMLFRLMLGNENLQPTASNARKQLLNAWANYEKPADARTLATKFTLKDLLRVAKVDADLHALLSTIGLKSV